MINKLVSEIKKKNAPIVVGLDPMLNYVPKHIAPVPAFCYQKQTPYQRLVMLNKRSHCPVIVIPCNCKQSRFHVFSLDTSIKSAKSIY